MGFRGAGEFARDGGRGGRVIDELRALPHAGERPCCPETDRPEIIVVSDAGEDEIAILGRLSAVGTLRPP